MADGTPSRVFVLTLDYGGYSQQFVGVFRTLESAKAHAEKIHTNAKKKWKTYPHIKDHWYLEDALETYTAFPQELVG
jgi:hypothetical protein